MMSLTLLACVAAGSGSLPVQDTPTTTTIFVVRHAEKDAKEQLSEAGKERAKALAVLMAKQNLGAVYSTNYDRTRDTAEPAAAGAKLKVQTYGPMPKRDWLAEVVRQNPGRAVLVVGHSNTVVPIVNGFGAKLKHKVGHDDYHDLFIVQVQGKLAQAVRINYGHVPEPPSPDNESEKAAKK